MKVERPGVQVPGRSEDGIRAPLRRRSGCLTRLRNREDWLYPPLSFVYRLTADWQRDSIGGFRMSGQAGCNLVLAAGL
jgi:hypothetical protein